MDKLQDIYQVKLVQVGDGNLSAQHLVDESAIVCRVCSLENNVQWKFWFIVVFVCFSSFLVVLEKRSNCKRMS